MVPGDAEAGPWGMPDGRADDDVTLPSGAPCEHPVIANKSAATTIAPRRPGW